MSGQVFHAPVIEACANIELTTILERSKSLSKDKYPNASIVRSYDLILADDAIDLVIVNTPNQLHYPMAKAAIEAGKHLVIEKPFTNTVAEGEELIRLAKEHNVVLSVFHNKRFEGDFLFIKDLIQEKKIGKTLQYAEFRFDRYRPDIGPKKWKENNLPGAGLLYDLGPHLIDQALHLFGQPKTIKSDIRIERKHGQVVDAFDIDFQYHDFKVRLGAGMLVKELGPKIALRGKNWCYEKHGADPQEQQLKDGLSPLDTLYGEDNITQYAKISIDDTTRSLVIPKGNYLDFYNNIADAILNNAPLLVKPQEALNSIRIIERVNK